MLETTQDSETEPEIQNTPEFQFDVPPFPATAGKLVSALNDSNTHLRQVIELIECEPKISSQVLSIANSPLYGASRSITTIGHAVVILGFKSVANLALTAAAGVVFDQGDKACQSVRHETYYQSLAIGTLARQIARLNQSANPDEAFLTGVIHDIGKLVLLETGGTDYADIIGNDELGNTTEHEHQAFGTTHPELGQRCGQKWGLPASMLQAISTHHESVSSVNDPISASLIAANYAARKWGIGFAADATIVPVDALDDYLNALDDVDLIERSLEQFEAIRDICAV